LTPALPGKQERALKLGCTGQNTPLRRLLFMGYDNIRQYALQLQ
jgi:hypothetical protein